MCKVKKHTNKIELTETDLEYPIYFYWQGEDAIDQHYSKITEEDWVNVSFTHNEGVKIEILPHTPSKGIPDYWFHNLCSKSFWEDCVEDLEIYLKIVKDE